MSSDNETSGQCLVRALEKAITHQAMWRKVTMSLYSFTTAGTIICSAAAAIMGALDEGFSAGVLAGAATVLISVEKSLMFREKWRLHVTTATRLENLKLAFSVGQIELNPAIEKLSQIRDEYATELPIAMRE